MNKHEKAKITCIERYGKDYYYRLGLLGGRKRTLLNRNCKNCGKSFRPKDNTKIFCSRSCSYDKRPLHGVNKICICGKEFYIRPSVIKENNYCSRRCAFDSLYKSKIKQCIICGKDYRTPISQEKYRGKSKYCSRKCKGVAMSINQKGVNNPSWGGGVSPEHHRIRQSKQFKDWRKSVFERDNYTCVICAEYGGYLEPHHIKPFAYFPDDRFDINNGQTMCKKCHKETDNYGHKAKKIYELAKT